MAVGMNFSAANMTGSNFHQLWDAARWIIIVYRCR